MPRMSKEERAELEAKLAADDDDDDDDEVEVGFGDGSYVKGRFRRVQDAAAARGFKLKPDPEGDAKTAKGAKAADTGNVTTGRFAGRRVS